MIGCFVDRNKRNVNSLIFRMIFFKALNNDHSLKQRFVKKVS